MKKTKLYELIKKGPVILDGATGSELQKNGMAPGVCPEMWILEHKDVLLQLQKSYVEAGTQILYAPTFSGNRIKLEEYGFADKVEEINKSLVALSKEAAGHQALVAGDLTMTGVALKPVGPMELEDLIDIYKEQVRYLYEAGVDLFVVETMMSLAETRAAVIAVKETCDLPVIASMTFQEDGRTLYGTDPVTAVVVLQSIGADVIGVNCSTGPAEMIPMIRQMKEYAEVPLLAKPNAGLPQLVDMKTVFPMDADEFASYGKEFVDAGVNLIGGCCGTTAEHIKKLTQEVKNLSVKLPNNQHPTVIASERKSQEISLDGNFLVIGERINPTGKKKLQEELRAGCLDLVEEMAEEQEVMGAHILDINMGTNGIDEKEMMLRAVESISMTSSLPLCIDTSHIDVMEAALRAYPGRAMMNSISLEKEKVEKLLPLAKKYGAVFILLPLSDKGLPENLEEKIHIIHEIMERAKELGIPSSQIVVDGLVATVGANKKAAVETLETIRYCKETLGLCTTVGLSNISFGLPKRPYVNAAFAAMAIENGLTMAIANPSNQLLMGLCFASDLLKNKEGADLTYIHHVQRMEEKEELVLSQERKELPKNLENDSHKPEITKMEMSEKTAVFEAVLKGNKNGIISLVKKELDRGTDARKILDQMLIPGINEVGILFDKMIYFLPQLIASANAMEKAIHFLEPMLQDGKDAKDLPVIVIATVEGDIHDIGKNLVALMLRNYGYEVIDLGKDVPADKIIETAKEHNAAIIALSALMTTTMMRMKDTIELRDEEGMNAKVIIGGAVTTQSYADEIGADGYSCDAADAVKLVKRLLGEE